MVVVVDVFEYLKDVDYFVKQVEGVEKRRVGEVERVEKGEKQEAVDNEGERVDVRVGECEAK